MKYSELYLSLIRKLIELRLQLEEMSTLCGHDREPVDPKLVALTDLADEILSGRQGGES